MSPGPIRKRDAERRRRNKDGIETTHVDLDAVLAGEVEIPAVPTEVDEETGEITQVWHPTAELFYLSLAKSGQAIFYEPSDWATAYLVAEQIHYALEPRPVQIGTDSEGNPEYRTMTVPMNGAALQAFLKAAASLMATEGDRRRLRIELDRKKRADEAIEGNVVPISQTRQDRFRKEVQK
jgi:hypothetical protein